MGTEATRQPGVTRAVPPPAVRRYAAAVEARAPGPLDALPLCPGQVLIAGIVLFALLLDGLDIQLLSFVAPAVMAELGVGKAAFGPALASALVGMAVGASAGGWLGDRIGAKRTLIGAMLLFGAATLLAGSSRSLAALILFRFVSGIGFGAAAPNGVSLAMDWLPDRARTRTLVLLSISTPLGAAIGASAVAWLLPAIGWRGCFYAVSGLTLILAIVVATCLPEALSHLLRRGLRDRAATMARRFARADLTEDRPVVRPQAEKARQTRALPAGCGRLAAGTALSYFCLQFVSFAFTAWAPIFLTLKGFTLPQALGASFAGNLAGVGGALVTSVLIERIGSRRILVAAAILLGCIVTAVAAALAPIAGAPGAGRILLVQIGAGGVGAMIGVSTTTLWTLMALGYPAEFRATGFGFGVMAGRIGCVLVLTIGGALISLDGATLLPFFVPVLLGAGGAFAAALLTDRHIAPRRDDAAPAQSAVAGPDGRAT